MRIMDVLTEGVVTCGPETTLEAAALSLLRNNCGALPVVADGGKLAGIITDRDICLALGARNARPSEITVGEAMTAAPTICAPGDDVRAALGIMRMAKVRRLPVVSDDGSLEGIVSISDIVLSARPGFGSLDNRIPHEEIVRSLRALLVRDEIHDDALSTESGDETAVVVQAAAVAA